MRAKIIETLYRWSSIPYTKWFRNKMPWGIAVAELLRYDRGSLGYHLGCFLKENNLEIQPQLEDHDVLHVLTRTGVTVQDEISMQFFLFGNGKRSPFMLAAMFAGAVFYPFDCKVFQASYARGKTAHRLHYLNFRGMLPLPITDIRHSFNLPD